MMDCIVTSSDIGPRRLEIGGPGREDGAHEGLRIAIDGTEPALLDLEHDATSLPESEQEPLVWHCSFDVSSS